MSPEASNFTPMVSARALASSPVSNGADFKSIDISSINESFEPISAIFQHEDEELRPLSQLLYPSSRIGQNNANVIARCFCSRFKLSDVASKCLFNMIHLLLPPDNRMASSSAAVQSSKIRLADLTATMIDTSNGRVCVLKFSNLITSVVKRNISSILKYNAERKASSQKNDIPNSKLTFSNEENILAIDLIPFTDGVTFIKSPSNRILWPIWLSLAQLPPRLRMSRKNIVLASLFVGAKKPVFESFICHIKQEALKRPVVWSSLGTTVEIRCKIIMLVADLIAKSHCLSMYQHNGHFGCCYCTARGATIDRLHCYYPYKQEFRIRESTFHEQCVQLAENLTEGGLSSNNVVGVKGRSAFSDIIPGLPLSACIDYMHCVLIGVYQSLLKLHIKLTTERKLLESFNKQVNKISFPCELVNHGRSVRPLTDLKDFKANEFFNYLFYVGVILLRSQVPDKVYNH